MVSADHVSHRLTPAVPVACLPSLPHPATDAECVDFHPDDLELDLTELSSMTGFLMNELPDNAGHFYPPWVNEPDLVVKGEPMMMVAESAPPRPQQQQLPVQPGVHAPAAVTRLDSSVGAAAGSSARLAKSHGGGGATFRKTAAGGVTRRRASSKEEQAKKRRERNRVLARRTRLRKKFFFQSLQQQVPIIHTVIRSIKMIMRTAVVAIILLICISHIIVMFTGRTYAYSSVYNVYERS